MTAPEYSIVIPAYNEERRVGATLETVIRYMDSRAARYEIIVSDDGSTDGTAAVVDAFSKAHPDRIALLSGGRNLGKGAAVRAGMLAAKGRYILFSDADLSTPIEELELLRSTLDGGNDIAIGSRALANSRILVHQPPHREFMGKLFNRIIRCLLRLEYVDTQCGFKLFSAGAAREVFTRLSTPRFAFDVEIVLLARTLGLRVAEVPVRWVNSPLSHVRVFSDSLGMLVQIMSLRKKYANAAPARRAGGSGA